MGGMTGPQTSLRIGLFDPGMTSLLRAGLGGVAAAVKAVGEHAFEEAGSITVGADAVTLDWSGGTAARLLECLFSKCFRIVDGLIDLPGSCAREPSFEVRVAMSDALRLTFLQHGKSAKKLGAPTVRTFEIDDVPRSVNVQAYESYVHQSAWKDIAGVLDKPRSKNATIALAGWANPGAVERHVGLRVTDIAYTPGEALCACFALIGCLSLQGPNRTGVLVIPEPSDLELFAKVRPKLGPLKLADCFAASAGDGVLSVHVALRISGLEESRRGVSGVSAILLRSTSWASQQKSRTDVLDARRYDATHLDTFSELMRCCPTRVVETKGKKPGEPGGYWGIPSALRGFVADNVAAQRPFYAGFATRKTADNPPRWLHRFHSGDDNLGALRYPDDKEGLIAMTESLVEAERLLVSSIHSALRNRFGAISKENASNPAALRNRLQGERDKWRLAFAGARTHEQVRFALADLWSRAGIVPDLQGDAWHTVQPLLRPEAWEAARDLALIALATYQGKNADDVSEPTLGENE